MTHVSSANRDRSRPVATRSRARVIISSKTPGSRPARRLTGRDAIHGTSSRSSARPATRDRAWHGARPWATPAGVLWRQCGGDPTGARSGHRRRRERSRDADRGRSGACRRGAADTPGGADHRPRTCGHTDRRRDGDPRQRICLLHLPLRLRRNRIDDGYRAAG